MAAVEAVTLTGLGTVRGKETEGGVTRYLALAYAAPIRERWTPPLPPVPWDGERCNPIDLPRCPQPGREKQTFSGHRVVDDESNCLVLNVFAPPTAGSRTPPLPVLFYIHGGAGKFGSCHDAFHCSGERLAREGVVYVAANYRLGALGFLAHPALALEDAARAEGAGEPGGEPALAGCGAYALLDLIAALRWVQQHVSAFGGDPSNVTIWGLSTGAQLVASLLVCPPAQGLFHKAMLQSCTDLCNVRELEARRESFCFAATDCYEPAADRRRLPGMSALHPTTSLEALRDGLGVARVPIMLGVTATDGLGKAELEWIMFGDVDSVDEYTALLRRHFGGERLVEALSHYPATSRAEVGRALSAISADLWYHASTWLMANLCLRQPRLEAPEPTMPPRVWLYRVTEAGYVRHGSDSPLWTGTSRARREGEARRLEDRWRAGVGGDAALDYLCHFARSGDPNGPGLPTWEPHERESARLMDLGGGLGMASLDEGEVRRFGFVSEWLEAAPWLSQVG